MKIDSDDIEQEDLWYTQYKRERALRARAENQLNRIKEKMTAIRNYEDYLLVYEDILKILNE